MPSTNSVRLCYGRRLQISNRIPAKHTDPFSAVLVDPALRREESEPEYRSLLWVITSLRPSISQPKPRLVTVHSRSPNARVFLRSPIQTDVPSLTARGNDSACIAYLPFLQNATITIESNERQVKAWRASSGINDYYLVVVLFPEHGGFLGIDNLKDATIDDTEICPFDEKGKSGECGIMLNSDSTIRGKGIAVEALDMNFAFAFDHLGPQKVEFFTSKENVPMKTLLEQKFGLLARWREEMGDWGFLATRDWWEQRCRSAGERRIIVDVQEMPAE